MNDQNINKLLVPEVDQASQILFYLAESNSPYKSLSDICARTGVHKNKVHSILQTLQRIELVQKNNEGKGYTLGAGLIHLSRKVLKNFNITQLAEPLLKDLADETGCTVTLGMIDDDKAFVVSKHKGHSEAGIKIQVGRKLPLTYGSHGKAIAANLSDEKVDELLQNSKPYFYGKPSRVNKAKLKKELQQCRKDGFALDHGEIIRGVYSAASAVIGPNDKPIGYIALLGIFSAETAGKFGPIVASAAKILSHKLSTRANKLSNSNSMDSFEKHSTFSRN